MINRAFLGILLSVAVVAGLGAGSARAQVCTAADFGAVVDQTALALRDLNVNGAKRFQTQLAALRDKHGLTQAEVEARTSSLQDDKIDDFNREIDNFVAQMDVLSQTPNSKITCDKLDELKRVRDRLLAVMGQKSSYMLAKVDAELDGPGSKTAQQTAATPAAPPPLAAAPQPEPATAPKQATAPEAKPAPDPQPQPLSGPAPRPGPEKAGAESSPIPALPERSPGGARIARNSPLPAPYERGGNAPPPLNDADRPTSLAPPPGMSGPSSLAPLPPPIETDYSISDIREAGRGVFGTITAEFAGAINYAFQQFGQPNAYISGVEGGAAFLAGLRYGKGTLHRKSTPATPIYWQGPSAGFDLGAEGSRAIFLVYNLDEPDAIYGRFSGIGGSAYVAGGVGLNVLGKGRMVMVPIRSGLGLRLGANLAYLKFTDRQTWNPF